MTHFHRRRAAAALASCIALLGCAASPSDAPSTPAADDQRSLYERVGGRAAIAAVVDDAIVNLAADPRINARFGNASIPRLQKNLVDLLCLRTGGPCTYTGANMSVAHEGMHIRSDEFDALIEDIGKSLDKFRVPPRERAEVLAILRQMKGSVIDH
ncbi:MAG TPA: group 1 truncated hemoglobin [Caldimonas sp.]|nr:group 1 truncated hemoglobin [Caldimonas sp.]